MDGALPIAPRPHVDELVSSWLARTAACYEVSLAELRQTLCSGTSHTESRADIGWDRSEARCAAKRLRIEADAVLRLDLKRRWPRLAVAWLPSTDGTGRAGDDLDLAWCHACLAEGHAAGGTYLDVEAALPLIFCHRHGTWRQDFCRRCRPRRGPRFVWHSIVEFICAECGVPLRTNRWSGPKPIAGCDPEESSAAFQLLFAFDGEVRKALLGQPAHLTGVGRVSPRQFLAVLHDLTQALFAPDMFHTSRINFFASPVLPNMADHVPKTWDEWPYREFGPLQRAQVLCAVIALLSDEPVSRLMSGAWPSNQHYSLEWLLGSSPKWVQAQLIQSSVAWPKPLKTRVQAYHHQCGMDVEDVLAQFRHWRFEQEQRKRTQQRSLV